MPRFLRFVSLCSLLSVFFPAYLYAQVIPGANPTAGYVERIPTPRDPTYKPPLLPEYQRRRIQTGAASLLLAPGTVNLEEFFRQREEQFKLRRKNRIRREERELEDILDYGGERSLLDTLLTRQFDVTGLPYYSESEHFQETPVRRFQTVFCISLPVTMAASYFVFRAIRQSEGYSPRKLNGPMTVGFLAVGTLAAGIIAGYDYYKTFGSGREEAKPADSASLQSEVESRIIFAATDIHSVTVETVDYRMLNLAVDFRF